MLCGVRAHAATPAESRFTEARTAFEAENFSEALTLFEQALALGLDGPAIHYNIGVAAYRSGDLARAERAFLEVARTPAMAALANYNLGLVALQRGDEKAARAWFERAARDGTDERLAALARRRLEGLSAAPAPGAWSLYARAGAGYDDNVALRSESLDTSASGEEDAFAELLLSTSYSFGQAWRADAAVAWLDYTDLDEFDQSAFSLGVGRGFSLDRWYLEVDGYAWQLSLGDAAYERSVAAGARIRRAFPQGHAIHAQMRVSAVDGEGDYTGLSGSRAELGLKYEWSRLAWSLGAHTRGELNDSADDLFATRWFELGAVAQWAWSPRWTFTADAALRRTRHPGDASTPDPWEDTRTTFRIGATRGLWRNAQVFLRYQYENNASPIDGYDYKRNWVAASIELWR